MSNRITNLSHQVAPHHSALNALSEVVIVGYARTAIGSFGGGLASFSATDLGAAAVKAALGQARTEPGEVEGLVLGHVLQAGSGQNPAKQVASKSGLSNVSTCYTVNKVCASGMKAVELAAYEIASGSKSIMVAGGMESMSRVPYLSHSTRFGGKKMGDEKLVDSLVSDGLWDVPSQQHMGSCAELTAAKFGISRQAQDAYAANSVARARAAARVSRAEIAPIKLSTGKVVDEDEQLQKAQPERLAALRPAFKKEGGTVTAGNGSSLSDGAAVLVLMSRSEARRRNAEIFASLVAFEDAERDSVEFTVAPALAVQRLLRKTRKSVDEISRWEINEAFAVVALANAKIIGISEDRLNVHGGAVALGHPLGASGARVLGALLAQLKAGEFGCAAICNGGGGASAVLIKRE